MYFLKVRKINNPFLCTYRIGFAESTVAQFKRVFEIAATHGKCLPYSSDCTDLIKLRGGIGMVSKSDIRNYRILTCSFVCFQI